MPVKVTETFENYVENVLDKEFMGYEVGRVEGVTPCERHFVIVTSKVAWYAVRVIIEPYTDDNDIYVKPYPKVTREGFFLQSQASEYVQETLYELQAKSNSACRQFDQHVTEQLHRYCFDKEVHRLRGQDVDGKRFAYVLLENFSIVQITEASNDNQDRNVPELELMKYDSKFNAERFFHDGFHKRKQLYETEQYASQTYKSHTEVKVRTNYNSTDNDYVDIDFPNEYESINSLNQDESNPSEKFKKFVKQCWAHAISGEEVYRRFGVTKAGQRIAFVVSKHNHYSVLVVLEPDPRYSQWFDDKSAVMKHSFTVRLKSIRKRKMMDAWMEQICKKICLRKSELVSKLTNFMNENYLSCRRTRKHLYTTPPSCVDKPDDYLIRGDHIRRNLKVATFNLTYHDGIYLGNGKVAHFTPKNGRGFFSSKRGSGAEIVSIEKFAKGERIFVTSYTSRPRSFNDVALEAEKLVEMRQWETRYNVLERNCQVFVRLCLNYVPSKKEFPSLFLDIVKKLEEDG